MIIDQISEHVENQTKEANSVTAETKTARFSIGGLIAAVLTALPAMQSILFPSSKLPRFQGIFTAI